MPLARAVTEPWQWLVLGSAVIVPFVGRFSVVTTLLITALVGTLVVV